jgi:type VI secretion system protein ImpA
MTASLAAALCEPIDDDAPCGPDLDLAYDPEYSLFVASAEGILPEESFFTFNRTANDLPKESRRTEALLQRSRDLRLLVLLAKFRILNRELDGFAQALAAMAALLRARWEQVHPAAEDEDFGLRIVVIESLDDMKSVIMPLQHAPLAMSRRVGAVNYRMVQIAQGEVVAREGEPAPDLATVESGFADSEMPVLLASRDNIGAARAALADMQACVEEQGAGSLSLDRLSGALAKVAAVVEAAIVRRDPAAAQAPAQIQEDAPADGAPAAATGPAATIPLATAAEISRALLSAELYFRTSEPSSPALLLVAQARQLVGKSLAESVQLLIPNHSSDAMINLGGRMVFDLPIERLAALVEPGTEIDPAQDEPPPMAATRREALDILQQVAGQLRVREPSSAIPLLCERARSLAERDFMSLLREMLPERAFRNLDET